MLGRASTLILLVALFLSMGIGIGSAHGSSNQPTPPAKEAKGKRNHVLSADYRSGRIGVDNTTATTTQFDDQGSLAGRPLGKNADLNELTLQTYNSPNCLPRCSGMEHTAFKAVVSGRGTFRGVYDFSFGTDGNPSGPIIGSITGGSGAFRGAKGSFQVLNRVAVPIGDTTGYTAHWQGSIRY